MHAPEFHDLAFSKLAAGRPKDIAYVRELLRCSLIGPGRLQVLIAEEQDAALKMRLDEALVAARRADHHG